MATRRAATATTIPQAHIPRRRPGAGGTIGPDGLTATQRNDKRRTALAKAKREKARLGKPKYSEQKLEDIMAKIIRELFFMSLKTVLFQVYGRGKMEASLEIKALVTKYYSDVVNLAKGSSAAVGRGIAYGLSRNAKEYPKFKTNLSEVEDSFIGNKQEIKLKITTFSKRIMDDSTRVIYKRDWRTGQKRTFFGAYTTYGWWRYFEDGVTDVRKWGSDKYVFVPGKKSRGGRMIEITRLSEDRRDRKNPFRKNNINPQRYPKKFRLHPGIKPVRMFARTKPVLIKAIKDTVYSRVRVEFIKNCNNPQSVEAAVKKVSIRTKID